MLIQKLIRRFFNDEPGAAGGGSSAPTPAPAPAPAPTPEASAAPAADAPASQAEAPAAAPAEQPETFGGLSYLLDGIGAEPAAAPSGSTAPAAPAAAPSAQAQPPAAAPAPGAKPPAAPAPAADELTPPEGMSERAAARWAQLTERVKTMPDLERRATEAEQHLGAVRQLVHDSGLAPDEFRDALAIGRMFKSTNPQELQQALQQIDTIRADIATRLGSEVPGVDLLSQHPDLKAQVEGLTLSREHAMEMIRLRTQSAAAQRTTQQANEFQQYQQTVQQAGQRIDAALAQRANTPGHQAKVAFIRAQLSDPQRQRQFVETYQPNQWEAAVLMMYDAYTPPAPAVAPAPPAPQPLRPGHAGAGRPVAQAPRNAMDAVHGAFESLGL
ncbi:MAG: hypothetical protein KF871_10885 [Hydrogenophaga sp.]|uniref:hypothetical protein n=1 Tax=Hydrogenophaga sp. TaxID=1904254 RepID=UPI001DD9C3C2|nr:hypothetical protein [Hydrogenophaga sp.]MBX3610387.1 hypothetical protein [Hydrogenophaga sp.]